MKQDILNQWESMGFPKLALILIITTNFVKKCFSFYLFSFEYKKKEKRKIHTKLDRALKFTLTSI